MQLKFVFGLLLIGACFTKVTFASPLTEEERSIIDDLIEQAKNGIKKLIDMLNKTFEDALNVFQKAKDQIKNMVQEVSDKFEQEINKIIASAKKEIDKIKQKAEELGIDISDCVENNDEQFKNIFDQLVEKEMQCVTKEVDKALTIVNEAIVMVTDAYQAVVNLPEKLKNCGTGLQSIKCIKNVIKEVIVLEKDLPIKIAGKVSEVTQFVGGLKARLETCAAMELVNVGIETAKVVAEVAKCAASKQ